MATHSSILAWRIPWTEEPRGLQFMGSQRVSRDLAHMPGQQWPSAAAGLKQARQVDIVHPGHYSRHKVNHVRFFATPWTGARQAPLSMTFSRRESWNGLPCPPPRDLPNLGIKPVSLLSPALTSEFFTISTTWEARGMYGCAYTQWNMPQHKHEILPFAATRVDLGNIIVKSVRQRQMLCDAIYTWNLKSNTNESTHETDRLIDTESKFMVNKGTGKEKQIRSMGLIDTNFYTSNR